MSGILTQRHVWEQMPAPTLDDHGNPIDWEPTASGTAKWGSFQYVIEGTDVTVINGAVTPVPTWARAEPFGPQSATLAFPQFTTFHALPDWAKPGANVAIRVRRHGGTIASLWEGMVVSIGDRRNASPLTIECVGVLLSADFELRLPVTSTAPRDVGVLLASVLNDVPGRRYNKVTPVVTGIQSTVAGGWEPLLTGFAQKILATAVKSGKVWTIKCANRTPVIAPKDTTTIAWEIRAGQRGVDIDLNLDATGAHNVIYGEGVTSRGGSWRNMVYPGWTGNTAPIFPFTDPSKRIRRGTTDADTSTGDGVSRLQRKLGRKVTGVWSRGDVAAILRAQRAAHILEDGIVGPQTWAAVFAVGANAGTLAGAYPLPLAIAKQVQKRLVSPDGTDLGPNPVYDPSIFRSATRTSYGRGVTLARAKVDAEQRLARNGKPGLAGTITLTIDPESKSRFELREGENGRIKAWRGQDITVHAAHVKQSGPATTLQVDTQARDYPELQALIARDRDAVDPAKIKRQELLAGKVSTDYPTYDAESPGGRIERHAIVGGLWTIAVVPIGSLGSVVKTVIRTSPAVRFSMIVCGKKITANQVAGKIGNPLTAEDNPFEDDTLDTSLGLLMGWGWKDQPGGIYPKVEWNHKGKTNAPVTGRLVDDSPWEYVTDDGERLYIATFASGSSFIEGRFYGIGAED